jgi:glycosyltransferase involved in cell wall biosynthesis
LGGAVEKVWFDLGREFVRQGHRVVHISRGFRKLPSREWIDGVEHLRVSGFAAPKSKVLYRMLDLVYSALTLSVLPAADIVVTNAIWLPILIRDSRYGSLYVHVGRYPKGQMWLYRHAARLQTVSTAVANAIAQQSPGCANKISVIPYPVAQTADPAGVKASWAQREKNILYAGRIHPEKGLEILLEGFARFARADHMGWRLLIVGPWETKQGGGGKEYYERLRAMSAPLDGRVSWHGPVFDRQILDSMYGKASLFVYPSIAETGESFGLAPLEAMSAGCPALVSALACFSDYIVDTQSGFIFDHRSNEPADRLAGKLSEITSAPANLANVAEQACRTASHFALPPVAQMYLADFARVTSGSTRAPTLH